MLTSIQWHTGCSAQGIAAGRDFICATFTASGFTKGQNCQKGPPQHGSLTGIHHWQICVRFRKVSNLSHTERTIWEEGGSSLNPRILRWTQGRVRASPAETSSRCRHRLPPNPLLCPWHCRSRQCGCHRSIRGHTHKGSIWSRDKAGWVGQVMTTDGERLQVLMLLGLEELKNCQIDPREGICCKRQW